MTDGNTTMTIGGLTSYIPFTSSNRPYRQTTTSLMPSFRPTESLKSHLNVLKSSVHLTPSMKTENVEKTEQRNENVEENEQENDENVNVMKYRLRFQFDCTIACQVLVHWNSVERLDAQFGHLKIVSTKSSSTPSYSFTTPLYKNKTLENFGEKSNIEKDEDERVITLDESTSFHFPVRTFGAGMGHVYESPILDFSNLFHRKRNLHNFSNNDNRLANDSDSNSDEQEEEQWRNVLFYDERVNFRYPLIIELRSLRPVHGEEEEEQDDQMEDLEMRENDLENLENEEEEKRRKTFEAERASKRSYQFTYVTFSDQNQNHRNMGEVLNTNLRVLRQKVQIDCKVYELAEIYSFNNTTTNDNHHRPHVVIDMDENRENAIVNMGENHENDEEEEEDDDESGLCVICMTNVADTSLIPCRHMCLCLECSHVLRTQTNKCPICRSKILTMIRVAPEDDTNANDGYSDDQER